MPLDTLLWDDPDGLHDPLDDLWHWHILGLLNHALLDTLLRKELHAATVAMVLNSTGGPRAKTSDDAELNGRRKTNNI